MPELSRASGNAGCNQCCYLNQLARRLSNKNMNEPGPAFTVNFPSTKGPSTTQPITLTVSSGLIQSMNEDLLPPFRPGTLSVRLVQVSVFINNPLPINS